MTEESKTKVPAAKPVGDAKIVSAYEALVGSLGKSVDAIEGIRREFKTQLELLSEVASLRAREEEQYAYARERQRQEDSDREQREQEERDRKFEERERVLAEQERVISDVLSTTPGADAFVTAKQAKTKLEAIIAQTVAKTDKDTRAALEKEYQTKAALDAAGAKATTDINNHKVAHLMERNAALEAENKRLLEQQAAMLDKMKDISVSALHASAGVQKGANEAMQTAVAQSAARGTGR